VIAVAVDACGIRPGQVAADLGFGGGAGLRLLLDATSPDGQVHGLELSEEMISGARRRHRAMVQAGRLVLHRVPGAAFPLQDSSLDAMISVNTVYFVADLAPLLDEVTPSTSLTGRMASKTWRSLM